MSSVTEAEPEDLGEGSLISLAEVTDVVKKLFSVKAPEVDEIRNEMLKAPDIVVWRSWTVPVERQTGLVVPSFRKGNAIVHLHLNIHIEPM